MHNRTCITLQTCSPGHPPLKAPCQPAKSGRPWRLVLTTQRWILGESRQAKPLHIAYFPLAFATTGDAALLAGRSNTVRSGGRRASLSLRRPMLQRWETEPRPPPLSAVVAGSALSTEIHVRKNCSKLKQNKSSRWEPGRVFPSSKGR